MSRINRLNMVRGLYSLYNWLPYYAGAFTPYPVGSFIINISRECEMRCMMCNIWQNRGSGYTGRALDAAALQRTLAESRVLGKMPYIVMTGGEPFLRKDFAEILSTLFAFDHVKKITVGTSAFLKKKILGDVEVALRASGPGKELALQVSLQGVGEVQDRIKGKKGCFKRVSETIEELKGLRDDFGGRLIIYIYSVLQKENKDTFEKTYEFAREMGVGYSFGIVNNLEYNRNQEDGYTKESITDDDIRRLERLYPVYGMLRTWNRRNFTQQTTGIRCFAAYSSFFMDFDGTVFPCLHTSHLKSFRMGNVFDEGFDDMWRRSERVRELTKRCGIDECLQGCDRAVVRLQYFLPDLVTRLATFNRYSLLRSRGMVER